MYLDERFRADIRWADGIPTVINRTLIYGAIKMCVQHLLFVWNGCPAQRLVHEVAQTSISHCYDGLDQVVEHLGQRAGINPLGSVHGTALRPKRGANVNGSQAKGTALAMEVVTKGGHVEINAGRGI